MKTDTHIDKYEVQHLFRLESLKPVSVERVKQGTYIDVYEWLSVIDVKLFLNIP